MKEKVLRYRFTLIFFMTALLTMAALFLAYSIRFDFDIPLPFWFRFETLLPVVILIKLPLFWHFGCFKGWWRYVSMPDLVQIFKANVIGTCLFVIYAVLMYRLDGIPRSVLFLDGLICFVLVGGVRFLTRAVREQYFPVLKFSDLQKKKRVLIFGAGHAGQMIAREIQSNPELGLGIVGFIDNDPFKQKTTFLGCPVLGGHADVATIVQDRQIEQIIIAIPSASGRTIQEIVRLCRQTSADFKILPGVGELINGRVSVLQARDVDLEDLLGRAPIRLDEHEISHYLHSKRVLISGAGGSIGSEICRQVLRFHPAELVLVDIAETATFNIDRELAQTAGDVSVRPIVGSVCDRSLMEEVFADLKPQVVFHAAAYKHVPLMESNPCEALRNNINGTCVLADMSDKYNVEKFVMISTDKAVRPSSIMGVSKRIAELYVQALDARSKTSYVTTRFGNVLGSNGSVIPIFKEQIAKGGVVTVTHPEVSRFFMTIAEASQLVLQAGSMGHGGEIYLFDMGEPIKIVTLAEELIRLSGFKPYEDIEIVFTGLRPGEKLHEELLLADEGVLPTRHVKIQIANSISQPYEKLKDKIESLVEECPGLHFSALQDRLVAIVPEYAAPLKNNVSSGNQMNHAGA